VGLVVRTVPGRVRLAGERIGALRPPTTIFINPAGKIVNVHTGEYESQGTLDGDLQSYALGG
jgi:hypothetical protein